MKHAAIVFAAASFALVERSDAPTHTGADSPLFEIMDAVHNSGNEHFFLPPIVSDPLTGTFDGSLEPVVEICELSLCGVSTLASFTTETGPGSETVRTIFP